MKGGSSEAVVSIVAAKFGYIAHAKQRPLVGAISDRNMASVAYPSVLVVEF